MYFWQVVLTHQSNSHMLRSKFIGALIISVCFTFSLTAQFAEYKSEVSKEELRFNVEEAFIVNLSDPFNFENSLKSERFEMGLPMPDGSYLSFEFIYDPIMADGLAKKYPNMRTYKIRSGSYRGRAGFNIHGFHATIHTGDTYILIDPAVEGDEALYMSYFAKSLIADESRKFSCEVDDEILDKSILPEAKRGPSVMGLKSATTPVDLKTYRLAVACTGEYATFHGGTVESALAAIVTTVNRVNTIYEIEHAIRLDLIENNDEVIFLDPQSDPYTNNNLSNMLNQNRTTLNSIIGNDNFDIGHVLGTFGGGLAQLGSVCTSNKARGATGLPNPVGDFFDVVYVCHEVGHQFNANHTFNFCNGENEAPGNAFEPASGTTIMAYAGLCGSQNLQQNTDFYFHVASLEEVKLFSTEGTGSTCANIIETGNTEPIITIETEQDLVLPIQTPFEIKGSAVDNEGDDVIFSWEQFDLGPESVIGQPQGTAPLFISQIPQASGNRFLPRFQDIINNQTSNREVLPSISRPVTFRLTARDQNEEAGGTSWETLSLSSTEGAGPFLVTAPQEGETMRTQTPYAVQWDVANTDQAPVNCALVDILYSRNNGLSFTDTLALGVANNGQHIVMLPAEPANNARIMVKAADHIFLNVNEGAFSLVAPDTATFTISTDLLTERLCAPDELSVQFETIPILGYEGEVKFDVDADVLPSGVTFVFEEEVVMVGEPANIRIEVERLDGPGIIDVDILAISDELGDTIRYPLLLRLQNDITGFSSPVNPASGDVAVQGPIDFEWEDVDFADFYNFYLYDGDGDIDRASPLFSATGVTSNTINTGVNFEPSKLYYWEIEAGNECGLTASEPIFVFQTPIFSCTTWEKEENIIISVAGTPTIFSDIDVELEGEVASVEVFDITGTHQSFNDMDFWIFPPNSAEQRLLGRSCATYNGDFHMNFSDGGVPFQCPPDQEDVQFRPVTPLSEIAGSNALGNWRLRIRDVVSGGGGEFFGWGLRICSDSPASIPQTIVKDTMVLRPGSTRFLGRTLLETTDNVKAADEIFYRLTSLPRHGTLNRQRFHWEVPEPLGIGDIFSQDEINRNGINYYHDDIENELDSFTFVVYHDLGGFIDNQTFIIRTDEDFVSSVSEDELQDEVQIFPNPANDILFVRLEGARGQMQFNILDLSGKMLISHRIDSVTELTELNINKLPQGSYILQGIGSEDSFTKMFLKQ